MGLTIDHLSGQKGVLGIGHAQNVESILMAREMLLSALDRAAERLARQDRGEIEQRLLEGVVGACDGVLMAAIRAHEANA